MDTQRELVEAFIEAVPLALREMAGVDAVARDSRPAGAADELDADMIGDCMGEVANVVAGQAKSLLVGSPAHFTLSTPTLRTQLGGGRT